MDEIADIQSFPFPIFGDKVSMFMTLHT